MIAVASLVALVSPLIQEKWELKPDVTPKSSVSYETVIHATVNGEFHEAEFRMVREVIKADEKAINVKYTWADLVVDEHSVGEDTVFETTLDKRGVVIGTTSALGDNARRMLSALSFPYPEGSIAVGNKWTHESKLEGRATQKFTLEALGAEKMGARKVLKLSVKLDEAGANGIHSDGTYWLEQGGKVIKFTIQVKNWIVPMAGPDLADADIRGELIPGK